MTEHNSTSKNWLKNSGFEIGQGNTLSNWSVLKANESFKTFWDSSVSYEGNFSIRVFNADESARGMGGWSQSIIEIPTNREFILSCYIKTNNVKECAGIFLKCLDKEGKQIEIIRTVPWSRFQGTHDWTLIETSFVPPQGTAAIEVQAGLWGAGQVWFDLLQLLEGKQVVEQPLPSQMNAPGIAYAEGNYILSASQRIKFCTMTFPLPIAYNMQAPISFEFQTEPEGRIYQWHVKTCGIHNWMAEIIFHAIEAGETLKFSWNSYVLLGDKESCSIPDKIEIGSKELPDETKQWLTPTVSVQSNHPEIRNKAQELRQSSNNLLELVQKVVQFTWALQVKDFKTVDALEALHKGGGCTSRANLAAALLRANQIPARLLATYPTWSAPLQTHYIVEAYASKYGWFWIEPMLGKIFMKPYTNIVVSVIEPADEQASFAPGWGMRGVPRGSVTQISDMDTVKFKGNVEGVPGCDHLARPARLFQTDENCLQAMVSKTQKMWHLFLGKLKTGEISEEVLKAQRMASKSRNPSEYLTWIQQLEGTLTKRDTS